jgi:archaellum component FlaC
MDHGTVDEIKRHFNAAAEGLRSDIRLVIEGLAANTDRLDRVEDRLDRVEVRLDGVELGLDGVRTDFGEFKTMIRPLLSRNEQ